MLADIQAVIFDLDGTLLDRRRSFEQFVRLQWQRFSHALDLVEQEQYVQTIIDRDRDGYGPRKGLFGGVIGGCETPSGLADELLRDYREGFPRACVLFPDAVATVSSLRAAGLKLGVITNGSARMQSRKVECLALSPMFDAILIAEAEGIHKPDRRIFERAAERLGVDPGRAVYVGDHPEVDIAGARAAGMLSVWRRDPRLSHDVEADAVIDEVADLLSLLGLERRDS